MNRFTTTALVGSAMLLAACSPGQETTAPQQRWTFQKDMIFPADSSLQRAEDGVALTDGRLMVADQVDGLRLIDADGSSRPFGHFADAGYLHNPPEVAGGPNGVTLEPQGTHILVADVFRGGIYRVDVTTETTEKIYQHPYGVNMARRDSRGGIWFSQSTANHPDNGEVELFRAVEVPTPDGAVFYLPPADSGDGRHAIPVIEGLYFANGLVLDETAGYLYVSETMNSRLLRFRVDLPTGQVSDRTVALEVDHPDNLEFDDQGRLWIASPIRSEIVVFDPATGTAEPVFRIATPASEELVAAIETRTREGSGWLDLMVPALYEPGPGLITGMILTPGGGPVYLTGLSKSLIKLER